MNTAFRQPIALPLLAAATLAGSLFGSSGSASAQSMCATPCFTVAGPDLTVSVSTTSVQPLTSHKYVVYVSNISGSGLRGFWRPGPTAANVRVNLLGSIVDVNKSREEFVRAEDDTGTGFTCYQPPEHVTLEVHCFGGTVAAGATAQITITTTAAATPGTYTSTATVDPYNEIAESDESNNTGTITFSVG